jgi:hypothetical protein
MGIMIIIVYVGTIVFLFIIINFLRFHINLVVKNNTTLEHLDAKRKNQLISQKYNVGLKTNWEQIFGKNICMWFLPLESRNEEYDGINYPRNEA